MKNNAIEHKLALENPTYSVDTSGTVLQWTAYKFTDKLGVSGTFDTFNLDVKNQSGSVEAILKDAEMNIITSSVNSGNEIRDPKVRDSFFKIFRTDTIFGKIIGAKKGKGALELKMNTISNDVHYDYSVKNDTLFLTTNLDLMQWDGVAALNSLNTECYELHTGLDGISILWPDVDITLKFPLQHK